MVVMAVPAMIMMMIVLWRLIKSIERLTGLDLDSILKGSTPKKKSEPA
jgi:hypothetical protein